ncbi:hypothetical protein, partial [Streptomyces acidiscabies]
MRERNGAGCELASFNVDPDLEAFAGRGWRSHLDPADAAERDQPLSVEALAQKIAELGPYDGVARFGELAE